MTRAGKGIRPTPSEYRVVHVRRAEIPDLKPGRYLVDEAGKPIYRTDVPISREAKKMDNDKDAPKEFTAPQPRLFASIIEGILGRDAGMGTDHHWSSDRRYSGIVWRVGIARSRWHVFVARLHDSDLYWRAPRAGSPTAFAGSQNPKLNPRPVPGVLLASGFIAGGTLCGLIIAFFAFLPDRFNDAINAGLHLFGQVDAKGEKVWEPDESNGAKIASVIMFGLLGAFLLWTGSRKESPAVNGSAAPTTDRPYQSGEAEG